MRDAAPFALSQAGRTVGECSRQALPLGYGCAVQYTRPSHSGTSAHWVRGVFAPGVRLTVRSTTVPAAAYFEVAAQNPGAQGSVLASCARPVHRAEGDRSQSQPMGVPTTRLR